MKMKDISFNVFPVTISDLFKKSVDTVFKHVFLCDGRNIKRRNSNSPTRTKYSLQMAEVFRLVGNILNLKL